MTIQTRLTELLQIRHPILLGPMDLVADARLTAAVSDAGGFGLLGGGYADAGWVRRELAALKGLGFKGRFGIGFITWVLAKRPEVLDIALEAKPNAVMLSFGDPAPFAPRIKAAGAHLICQVQSEDMAQQALDAGADILVAQGTEAGGHGCDRPLFSLLPAIVDAAAGRAPVVAAGGIADGRGLAASLAFGAGGVLLGTRFYASEEAAGFPEAKRRICAASAGETIRDVIFDISRNNVWPAPFTGRCLLNDHARQWQGRTTELMRHMHSIGPQYEAARSAGNFDMAAVIAGQAVGLIHDVPPAKVIVERIASEAERIMAGASNAIAAR